MKEIKLGASLKVKRTEGEKFGIEELKKLIRYTGKVEDDISDIVADGKVGWFEVAGIVLRRTRGAVEIAAHAKDIKNEFLDLSDAEIIELTPVIEQAYEIEEGKALDAVHEYIIPLWELLELSFEHIQKIKRRKVA